MSTPDLTTPVHVKATDADDFPAGDERVCYVLTSDGVFIGRQVEIAPGTRFRSLVPAPAPPAELAPQRPTLTLHYPRIPGRLLARIVAFFRQVARRDGGEAIVLLAVGRDDGALTAIVPRQHGTVWRSWRGDTHPIDLQYELDEPLPPGHTIVGDVHSHVFESAYASSLDTADERHAPGLHVVVGHVDRRRPSWWAEFVVDGFRFEVPPERVLALPETAWPETRVPREWMQRVRTTVQSSAAT